jgi:transcriptional regulator GlxA family with amidase domain
MSASVNLNRSLNETTVTPRQWMGVTVSIPLDAVRKLPTQVAELPARRTVKPIKPADLAAALKRKGFYGSKIGETKDGILVLELENTGYHWNVLDAFKERFPKVSVGVERLFIDEGDLITCAGSTAAIDLGLYLVARHCGRNKAQQAMRHMMVQDMRPANMPQPHFYAEISPHLDVRVQQAAQFIEQRLDTPPPIAAVARYVGISPRQLQRLFVASLGQSPAAFQRKLRLEYARWQILNSKSSLTNIAIGAGFSDSAHLSRDFKAAFGDTPRSLRKSI